LFAVTDFFEFDEATGQAPEAESDTVELSLVARYLTFVIANESKFRFLEKSGAGLSANEISERVASEMAQFEDQLKAAVEGGAFDEKQAEEIRKAFELTVERNSRSAAISDAFDARIQDKAKPWFGDAEIVDYFVRNQKDFDAPTLTDEARTKIVELLHSPGSASTYLLSKAKVRVDKRFGTWVPEFGIVEPPVARRANAGIDLGG